MKHKHPKPLENLHADPLGRWKTLYFQHLSTGDKFFVDLARDQLMRLGYDIDEDRRQRLNPPRPAPRPVPRRPT